jgi:hypothetical protein
MIYYENLKHDDIFDNLLKKTSRNSNIIDKINCNYDELFEKNQFFYKDPFSSELLNEAEIKQGGEYWPENCNTLFSVAIIVPYRNRANQLKSFLRYMHNYLRKQQIHYKIFIVEQADSKAFNRAKLFNIGASYALRENFPCLIMQDVDLMPLKLGNIYACTERPRHMSSALDSFRFNLPYYGLFGGAIAMTSDTFIHINGFSNMFQGWGGEDDDIYARLVNKKYRIIRFNPSIAQYTMLKHSKEIPSPERYQFLRSGYLRFDTDGLNSLVFREIGLKSLDLYTNILVEV